MTAQLDCTADVASRTVTCSELPNGDSGPHRVALLVGQPTLDSRPTDGDPRSLIYGFDARLQNLLAEPIGTPDGVQRLGAKVFFEHLPTTGGGDPGPVAVHNASGHAHFSQPNQPYYLYDTILQPQQVSTPRRWEFRLPRGVASFRFSVRVFTWTPAEQAVPDLPPQTTPAWFRDRAHSIACHGSATCVRGVVRVEFTGTATREQRQAAVNSVDAVVVGGAGTRYYLHMPSVTTLAGMEDAQARLTALPQVRQVSFIDTSPVSVHPVPDTPPQTTPDWFSDRALSIPCYGRAQGTCLRNVLSVQFAEAATREQRQAAVDAVGGIVVGGGGPQFYIHMPAITTLPELQASMARLRSLPQVLQVAKYDTSPISFD